MPLFEWTAAISVGNEQVDDDHKHLISLINTLFDAISAGQSNQVLGEILDQLLGYTESHFLREEVLMQKIGYDGYEEHKAAHDELMNRVRELQAQYAAGLVVSPMNVFGFLGDWLFKHIKACDKHLGAALMPDKNQSA